MGRPWVIIGAHPDDLTLFFVAAIPAHLNAGREVYPLQLTAGTGSGAIRKLNGETFCTRHSVYHDPDREGYQRLTPETMGERRVVEERQAMATLGVPLANMRYAWELIGAPVVDGQVTETQVRAALLALLPTLDTSAGLPGVWAPSWLVDDNPDHRNAGLAVRALAAERPDLIADVRYGILPRYVINNDARLAQVTGRGMYSTTTTDDTKRAILACHAFDAYQPLVGAHAIGYTSVTGDWQWIDGTSGQPRSWYHK